MLDRSSASRAAATSAKSHPAASASGWPRHEASAVRSTRAASRESPRASAWRPWTASASKASASTASWGTTSRYPAGCDSITSSRPAAEFGPQPGNQRLQGVTGVHRQFIGPQLVGERGRRHDTPGIQGEQNEQDAQLTAADGDGAPVLVSYLKRAQ
jgi:hypothetical protein